MDKYIDYQEVSEYGRNFVSLAGQLVGVSDIVDMEKLRVLVSAKVEAVEVELQKARQDRSDLRAERGGTSEAEEAVRDVVARFYYHLRSLPKSAGVDIEAFFAGGIMGEMGSMKPADLHGKAADVLRGFDVAKNQPVAGFGTWKAEINQARQTLEDALSGKGDATGKSFVATAALVNARKDFLQAYNRVAKPIVRGVLNSCGRENELALFFKDLAVNEGGKRGGSEASDDSGANG